MSSDLAGVWEVALSDGVHRIEFEHGTTTGKRVIYVDGKVWMMRHTPVTGGRRGASLRATTAAHICSMAAGDPEARLDVQARGEGDVHRG